MEKRIEESMVQLWKECIFNIILMETQRKKERERVFFLFYLIFMNKRERDFPTVIWNTLISS